MSTDNAFTAKIYDPMLYFALRRIRQEIIRLIFDREARILDLCCGTGDQLKKLSDAGFCNLTGVDLSSHMLKVARKGNKIGRLIQEDVRHTGLGSERFDTIIISFAVHEKTADVQEGMLDEAHRLLAPDGQLILVDFSLDDRAKMIGKFGVTLIEGLAGGEHFRNFKAYVASGGMDAVLKERFEVQRQIRHAFGAVSTWVLRKPFL